MFILCRCSLTLNNADSHNITKIFRLSTNCRQWLTSHTCTPKHLQKQMHKVLPWRTTYILSVPLWCHATLTRNSDLWNQNDYNKKYFRIIPNSQKVTPTPRALLTLGQLKGSVRWNTAECWLSHLSELGLFQDAATQGRPHLSQLCTSSVPESLLGAPISNFIFLHSTLLTQWPNQCKGFN